MKYLLDTHTLIWAARQPEKLGPQARTVLEARSNERLISVATFWEMGIKFNKGRLPEAELLLTDPNTLLRRLAASILPISLPHVLLAPLLTWDHADPFDRMLAAQAITEKVAFVSVDPLFDKVDELDRIW